MRAKSRPVCHTPLQRTTQTLLFAKHELRPRKKCGRLQTGMGRGFRVGCFEFGIWRILRRTSPMSERSFSATKRRSGALARAALSTPFGFLRPWARALRRGSGDGRLRACRATRRRTGSGCDARSQPTPLRRGGPWIRNDHGLGKTVPCQSLGVLPSSA